MKEFNAKEEKDRIVKFIRDYYEKNNLGGVVIGISGGKDSGVVAGLFTEALGKENVLGVTLPCHSKESDRDDAKLVSEKKIYKEIKSKKSFSIKGYIVTISPKKQKKESSENITNIVI